MWLQSISTDWILRNKKRGRGCCRMGSHLPILLDSPLSDLAWCQYSSPLRGLPRGSDHGSDVSASLLAHLGAEWPRLPGMLLSSSAPPHCLSLFSLFISVLPAVVPQPLQSCWMTSTLWSGCCAVFPLTAQGAGQCPWMPRWRITCTSAPTTCASSGTGCAQARMTPSASTVPPATKRAAATALAGTDCFASCTSGRSTHLLLSPLCPEVMWLAFSCLDGTGARLPGGCSAGCSSSSHSPSSLPPNVTYSRWYLIQQQSLALESILISVTTIFKSRCFSSCPEQLGNVPLLPSCH